MSIAAEDTDVALLSNGTLTGLLEEAELEERRISVRRREIQGVIDASPRNGEGAPEQQFAVAALSREERELSATRLQLHQRIQDLRLEKSRRIDGIRMPLKAIDSPDIQPAPLAEADEALNA